MKSKCFKVILLTLLIASSHPGWAEAQKAPTQLSLDQLPRVYGLSVAASKPTQVMLATPLGLYLATPEGKASAVAGLEGNVMAFAAHPANARTFLAGGHVGKSGSIGVMLSSDGGKRWKQISENAAGHVGFHILEFSKADPNTVYGITNGLRVSGDGGRTWRETGRLPEELIHFAASARAVNTLYAATRKGLLISQDQGASWKPAPLPPGIVSMVHVSNEGRVYAFVVGTGLMAAQEPALEWQKISSRFEDQILLRMVLDPTQKNRMFAATVTGAVVLSEDGGGSWRSYEGSHNAKPEIIARGATLFNSFCQSCHGATGKGQHTTPGFDSKNPPPIPAPALDDSAHAWHHSDENLTSTILNGSPREGSPMIAWKGTINRPDAEALVAYIKSLWSFRSIACQGARHMSCMQHQ